MSDVLITSKRGDCEFPSPHPLADLLPPMFHGDDFVLRWCGALDRILSPALVSLDCFDAYLSPSVTATDFLNWLGNWMGLSLDQNWDEDRRRELVRRAAELYRWRGTAHGIGEHVRLYAQVAPEIEDSGGVLTSLEPDSALPGSEEATVLIRIVVSDPEAIDVDHLDAIVAASKPAHVKHRVEIVPSGSRQRNRRANS
jgi:phage tail-like protein